MPEKRLQQDIERLRAELGKLAADDHATRERLNALISDLETRLARPDDADHHRNLLDSVRRTIHQFETEHPRATAILNDIMVTLSNMGI
jgi:hypothetical protein